MKAKEIAEKLDKDLLIQLKDLRLKLTKLNFQIATKDSNKSAEISKIKKDIARIKTILKERDISRKEETDEKKA